MDEFDGDVEALKTLYSNSATNCACKEELWKDFEKRFKSDRDKLKTKLSRPVINIFGGKKTPSTNQ